APDFEGCWESPSWTFPARRVRYTPGLDSDESITRVIDSRAVRPCTASPGCGQPLSHAAPEMTNMLQPTYPYYLASEARQPNTDLEVTDKYSGEVATRVALADAAAIDAGIAAAVEASEAMRRFAPYQRQAVLEHCVARFRERFDELAMALCIEAGKPIRDARGEVTRLIDTFKVAAEEAVR